MGFVYPADGSSRSKTSGFEIGKKIEELSQEIKLDTITDENHNELVRNPSIGGMYSPISQSTPNGSIIGSPPRNARRRFEPVATLEEIAERKKRAVDNCAQRIMFVVSKK